MFEINFTTITPLCQIDEGGEVIRTKKMPVMVNIEGGNPKMLRTPIYTANGFRGMLRRVGYELILEALFKKGNDHTAIGGPTNFHLHNAGGGNNFQRQSIANEKMVRELSPLISVFGASLAIEGKLIVDNFVPKRLKDDSAYDYCYGVVASGEREGALYSNILAERTYIKKDDLLDHSGNARFLDESEITAWEEFASDNQAMRLKVTDKTDKDRVKKETIKHIQSQEFVIEGVTFYGGVDVKMPLTELETGMMIRILERACKKRLGAGANTGHGKVEYSIGFMDGCSIETSFDDAGKQRANVCLVLTEDGEKCAKLFDKWLENIDAKNVQLDKILK